MEINELDSKTISSQNFVAKLISQQFSSFKSARISKKILS